MERAFTVSGVSRATGRACSIRVEAPSAAEACLIARKIGYLSATVIEPSTSSDAAPLRRERHARAEAPPA